MTSHASADTELVIEACGELSDIRQLCAIDRCDRNRPAETAGPESASLVAKVLDRTSPDPRWRPPIIEEIKHLTPGHSW